MSTDAPPHTREGEPAATGMARYRRLFAVPGALRMSLAAFVGRLPSGMFGLVLVIAIARSSSYTDAGAAAACYAIGVGVSGPVRGRAVDRRGARRVLLTTGVGQSVATFGLLFALTGRGTLASWGIPPQAVVLALSLVVGALLPPIGPVMRTMWRRALDDDGLRSAAFALESVVVDGVYIIGPSAVALLLALGNATLALAVTAVFTAAGCLVLGSAPAVRRWQTSQGAARDWLGPLRVAPVRWMLPVGLLATGSISGAEVALLATAGTQGHSDVGGLLIAAFSVGSVFGGLAYGALKLRGTSSQHLGVVLAVLAAGYAAASWISSLWGLAVLFAVAGLALAPMMTAQFTAMEEVAPEDAMTESFAWLNALGQGGGALASALAGSMASSGHPGRGFLVSAAMSAIAALLTIAVRAARKTAA